MEEFNEYSDVVPEDTTNAIIDTYSDTSDSDFQFEEDSGDVSTDNKEDIDGDPVETSDTSGDDVYPEDDEGSVLCEQTDEYDENGALEESDDLNDDWEEDWDNGEKANERARRELEEFSRLQAEEEKEIEEKEMEEKETSIEDMQERYADLDREYANIKKDIEMSQSEDEQNYWMRRADTIWHERDELGGKIEDFRKETH